MDERRDERDEGRRGVVGREGALCLVCDVERGADDMARGVVDEDIVVADVSLKCRSVRCRRMDMSR